MIGRPRIRTLKPEAWQDERIGQVSRDARLLFVVLITLADDEGRFRNLPSLILGHGFPYDQDAGKKLTAWMTELWKSGLIDLYEVDGNRYGVLPSWSKHQRINKASPSILPEPSVNGHGSFPERSRNGHGIDHD
jgi:hypothetical protein